MNVILHLRVEEMKMVVISSTFKDVNDVRMVVLMFTFNGHV